MNYYDSLQLNNLKKAIPWWLTGLAGVTTAMEGTYSVQWLFPLDGKPFTPFSGKASHFFLSPLIQVGRPIQYSIAMARDGNIL